jgi:hypothetical protein
MKPKTPSQLKTLQDYYDFYAAIPANKWCVDSLEDNGKCCAIGHLGLRSTFDKRPATIARLAKLINYPSDYPSPIVNVNNLSAYSIDGVNYKQKNPRARVLAYLRNKIIQRKK